MTCVWMVQGYSGDDITSVCETAKRMPVKRVYTPDLLNQLRLRQQDNGHDLRDLEKERLIVTKVPCCIAVCLVLTLADI